MVATTIERAIARAVSICQDKETYRTDKNLVVLMDPEQAWKLAVRQIVKDPRTAIDAFVCLLAENLVDYWRGEGEDFVNFVQDTLIRSTAHFLSRIEDGFPDFDEMICERVGRLGLPYAGRIRPVGGKAIGAAR